MEDHRDDRNPEQGRGYGAPGEDLYGKAKGAAHDVADKASEMWDGANREGERYYREGTRAVRNIDGGTLTAALIAGVVGYALAYLIHGERSYSNREGVPDYARTR